MEEILSTLVVGALQILVLGTARGLVRVLSRGRWRGEDAAAREGRIYGAAGGFSFQREGQRVITTIGLFFIGSAFYVLLGAALLFLAA